MRQNWIISARDRGRNLSNKNLWSFTTTQTVYHPIDIISRDEQNDPIQGIQVQSRPEHLIAKILTVLFRKLLFAPVGFEFTRIPKVEDSELNGVYPLFW